MVIFFIVDFYFCVEELVIIVGFLCFLVGEVCKVDVLYIFGDLFEVWIGDDDFNLFYCKMVVVIKVVFDFGVFCYFIYGNCDFLFGKCFVCESGMMLLLEEKVFEFYGCWVLIMYGDMLCIDDVGY